MHVFSERRWREEQRERAVTRARGESSLREVQQAQALERADSGLECHDRAQTNLNPFGVTPVPTTEPSNEELGDPKVMGLN